MRRGEASTRIDGRYFALREVITSPYPLVEFGTLVTMEPDYGLSSRAVTRTSETEPRYIRITDFGEDGIAPGHEFVTAESWEAGYELGRDDILFARSGSVGKTYLHEDTSEPAVFAGYCIRFKFDASKVMPRFVYWWTKTAAYSRWVEAIQRPSVQSNINKDEFKGCLIPLPSVLEQERLVTRMDTARAERKAKLAEADALLAGIDGFLLDALGVAAPIDDGRRVFAVRRGDMTARVDVRHYALRGELSSSFPIAQLGTLVWTEPDYGSSARAARRTSADEPRYIRITDFGDDGIEPGHEFVTANPIESGYNLEMDDVLFARSGSVGKTYIHEDISEPAIFAGYCIRFRFDKSTVSPKFVYWWTKTSAYSRWVEAIQRPSVQANINKEEFKSCPIPLPSLEEQERLTAEVESVHRYARQLRAEAEAGWEGAKGWFEVQLLGTPKDR